MNKLLTKTKRGGASMFIVMFTIIVLSIITLSFTRLVLSEATKTSNTDLSQSAYDSALAGVEDAKIALLRYHACLDQGYTKNSPGECGDIIRAMQNGIATNDCSTIEKVLKREQASDNHAVVVQETQDSTDQGNNTKMLQAYTCVTIKEDLEDYRTTLNASNRLRIIPIRASNINNLAYIQIKWFSRANLQNQKNTHLSGASGYNFCDTKSGSINLLYPSGVCNGLQQSPTTLTARLIQTDKTFDLSEMSVARANNQTNTGQLTFIPSRTSGATEFSGSSWSESADKGNNLTEMVKCDIGAEWLCNITLELPKTFKGASNDRGEANTYLLVSLPYGSPETDVSITAYAKKADGSKDRFDFTGVQARIDSTGRANDLYRRVETRVELVDTYFAYPEFEITMTDSTNDSLDKSFYATFDCYGADDGAGFSCPNSAEHYRFANY